VKRQKSRWGEPIIVSVPLLMGPRGCVLSASLPCPHGWTPAHHAGLSKRTLAPVGVPTKAGEAHQDRAVERVVTERRHLLIRSNGVC
jgi:hypothetical protein